MSAGTGYASAEYARTCAHLGVPRTLPRSGVTVLVRDLEAPFAAAAACAADALSGQEIPHLVQGRGRNVFITPPTFEEHARHLEGAQPGEGGLALFGGRQVLQDVTGGRVNADGQNVGRCWGRRR